MLNRTQMIRAQSRTARAGLCLSARELAEEARVSAITRFECGEASKERSIEAIRDVFTVISVGSIPENTIGVTV